MSNISLGNVENVLKLEQNRNVYRRRKTQVNRYETGDLDVMTLQCFPFEAILYQSKARKKEITDHHFLQDVEPNFVIRRQQQLKNSGKNLKRKALKKQHHS